jgi:hypothetical protein
VRTAHTLALRLVVPWRTLGPKLLFGAFQRRTAVRSAVCLIPAPLFKKFTCGFFEQDVDRLKNPD